jgi:hypothetical protein
MLKRYSTVFVLAALCLAVLTTSGCYTVLQFRSQTISHPEIYGEVDYEYWYDPFYAYHPYNMYSYSSWYYTPWTYGYCSPYWSYPTYWRTYYASYDSDQGGRSNWQSGTRRRGFQTRTSVPGYTPASPIPSVQRSGGERKSLKTLRKVDTGTVSTPSRRSGISMPITSTHSTVSTSPTSVSRSSSSLSSSSPKPGSSKQSPSPTKRRGSKH